jgi:hypothetical protein
LRQGVPKGARRIVSYSISDAEMMMPRRYGDGIVYQEVIPGNGECLAANDLFPQDTLILSAISAGSCAVR